MHEESPISVNSFLTHGPAAAAAFSAHHNSNSARKRRFSQQATSQQESPLNSHYGFEEDEEQMMTNGQKRKLLSDLLISEQHIKIEDKNEFARHSNGVSQEEFAIDSELVQDLSMTKSRFEQLNSGEQNLQDKLSDDEMDSQSFASNAGKSMDNSDNSVASDEEEEEEMADLNGRTKVQMMNGFKLEKNHYESEEKLTLDLPRKYSNDECAPNLPNGEEEATDKTLNDKVDEQTAENADGIIFAQ